MGKQAKTKRDCYLEKVRECQRQDFLKHKEANPQKVKQMEKQAKTKGQESHLEKNRECQRQGFKKYKQANPDKVQLSYKMTFKLNWSSLKWYFPAIDNECPEYTVVATEVCSKAIISIL